MFIECWTHQLMSFTTLRKRAVQFLASTTIESAHICQILSNGWWLVMCLHQAVNRWFPSQTKNILPTKHARWESLWSMASNSALASCHNGLHEDLMSSETSRGSSRLLYAKTYKARSPSRYPMTNSFSKRKTSTSLIGRTRGRVLKRHNGIEKRDFPRGLNRSRWITVLESCFCDLRIVNSASAGFDSARGFMQSDTVGTSIYNKTTANHKKKTLKPNIQECHWSIDTTQKQEYQLNEANTSSWEMSSKAAWLAAGGDNITTPSAMYCTRATGTSKDFAACMQKNKPQETTKFIRQ